jgi:hypothetical protein
MFGPGNSQRSIIVHEKQTNIFSSRHFINSISPLMQGMIQYRHRPKDNSQEAKLDQSSSIAKAFHTPTYATRKQRKEKS